MRHRISKGKFIRDALSGGAGLAGIIGWGCAPGLLSKRRPNIVLVTIDTQRYDRLGFNGYERDTSPYLDWISKNGVVFDGNFSQAPSTLSSTASLMISLYPRDIGMHCL